MNILSNLVPDEIISALGWTIVHSLWQGALVAVMLASLLVIMRKTESRIRSLVSIGALVIFLALTVRTFIDTYNQSTAVMGENFVLVEETGTTLQQTESEETLTSNNEDESILSKFYSLASEAGSHFRKHLTIIVTVWLMGVLMLTLKLIGGFAYSERLKNYKTFPVSEKWNNKFKNLCNKIELSRPVKFAESAIIKAPVAIGYLKPVILLPLGTLTGLPASQIEAILVHELAHIARADYIINILQSIIETIFFYHPAVWWISSTVRKERENCCDDIAVEITGDSFNYAKALVNVQAFGTGEAGLAMAAIGKNEKLFRRINRMILKQRTPGLGGKLGAASILLVSLFAATLISCSSTSSDDLMRSHREITHLEDLEDFKSYDEGEKTLSFYEKEFGKRIHWEVYLDDGEIVKLYKDGDRIPDDELYKYEDKMLRKLRDVSRDLANLDEDLKDLDIELENLDEEIKAMTKDLVRFDIDRERHDWDKREFKEEMKRFKRDLRERQRNRIRFDIDEEKLEELEEKLADISIRFDDDDFRVHFENEFDEEYDFEFDHDFDFDFDIDFDGEDIHIDLGNLDEEMEDLRAELKNLKIDIDIPRITIPDIPPLPDLSDLKIDMRELNRELAKLEDFMDDLRSELADDGLIEDEDDDFDLEYDRGEMYINGDRVPDDLREKYEDLYEDHFDKELDDDSHFHIH
ncbi:M56 family metallopeptidase [Bacteroidota bacterium]